MNQRSKALLTLGIIIGFSPLFVALNAQAQDFSWPVDTCNNVVTYYTYRSAHFHQGIDISCGDGNFEVLAAADGEIIDETDSSGQCTYDSSYGTCPKCDNSMGNSITIMHPNGVRTVYMHLQKKYKHKGAKVTCGEAIGKMGTTGCSTGTHLHFTTYVNGSLTDKWTYGSTDDPLNYAVPGKFSCDADSNARGIDRDSVLEMQNTDIDGDGYAEMCIRGVDGLYCVFPKTSLKDKAIYLNAINDANGWDKPQYYSTIRFADINGDSMADVCARGSQGLKCWFSTGSGFTDGPSVPMSDADGYDAPSYYATIKLADINGDGKDDFCARFDNAFRCYPSLGDAFSTTPLEITDLGNSAGAAKPQYYTTIRVADINADGMADVCARLSTGWRCWPSAGDSFKPPVNGPEWSDAEWAEPKYYATIRMPDINGDHKADLCARDKYGIVCHLSTGNGWSEAIRGPEWSDAYNWGFPEHYHTVQFGDFNGDGMDDICARADAGLYCYLANGNGFDTSKRFTITEFKDDNRGSAPSYYRTIHMGDYNGDHKMDICGRNPTYLYCYSFNGSSFDRVEGTNLDDQYKWGFPQYAFTFRFGGPKPKDCTFAAEICDGKDNNCNGEIDEGLNCCTPSEEICDGIDNNCNGEIDEGLDCCTTPSEEICDGKDNNCNGEIDEGLNCCTPSEEICDGKDNNCNGEIDEGLNCCIPSEEICDNKDNNCNGEIDEGDVCKQTNHDNTDNHDNTSPDDESPTTSLNSKNSEDSCSSQPSSTPTMPSLWFIGLCGLFGIAVYRRRRKDND